MDLSRAKGVPLPNKVMEYTSRLRRSSLTECGLDGLECGSDPPEQLVRAIRKAGVDEDRAEVGAAILCLMLGGVDEAHNLVTPHSWPSPTSFGGPPKPGSTACREALYCHMIVHRMEGSNIGEFGMG